MITHHTIQCAQRSLDLREPQIMGIINVTPDSFSDGGNFIALDQALLQAETMVNAGAAIIDIGGESTRPGSQRPNVETELARVLPLVEAIASRFDVIISVDTSTAAVIKASYQAGAHLINDVRALRDPDSLATLAQTNMAVCLMHMQGQPETMNQSPHYDDVVSEVYQFLQQQSLICQSQGIAHNRIIVDPGFGFGKTFSHNLQLLAKLANFQSLGLPILIGVSRKKLIGILLAKNQEVRQLGVNGEGRLIGGLALAAWAIMQGTRIIRTHDVGATQDLIKTLWPVIQQEICHE